MLIAPKVCMPFGEHPKSVGAQNQNRRAHPFGCLGGYFGEQLVAKPQANQ